MDRGKAEQGRGRKKRKSKKKEDAGARKGRKVAKHCVFSWFCGSGGLKSRLVQISKKCTPLWREVHFEVKMYKTLGVRTTFGGSDVEKVYAAVARSTCPSQNVQNTRGSDHFWRFRYRFASLHYTTLHSTTLRSTTLHYITQHHNYNYTPLHSTTLHYTPLHSTTLHYTPLHSTTLHFTTLHYTTLNYATLHYSTLHYTTLHSTTVHYTTLHYTTLHWTEWHCATDRQVDR